MCRFILLLLLVILSGCSTHDSTDLNGKKTDVKIVDGTNENDNTYNIIAQNFNIPWAINKLDDEFYISERTGTIVKIQGMKAERQNVILTENLSSASEAGLLGFVLSPNFKKNNLAYAYYTYSDEGKETNRIVELEYTSTEWKEQKILLDNIPSGVVHHGGRLKIGPDGKLYATTGDAADPELAQDVKSLAGKILRINLDGTVPYDNPFPGSYIYTYGHRNPQGLAWDNEGQLYSSEHGNSANDEINRIEAGVNYGWSIIQGLEEQDEMRSPIFTSGKDATWAPSGIAYHEGKLYVAALRGKTLLKFDLHNGNIDKIVTDVGRIRDVWIENDMIYFITNNTDGRGNPKEDDDKLYSLSIK